MKRERRPNGRAQAAPAAIQPPAERSGDEQRSQPLGSDGREAESQGIDPHAFETTTFDFRGNPVRATPGDAHPLFVVADICAALGHTDPSKAVSRLEDDEKGVIIVRTLGGPQSVNVVSESGLYALILTSRKPQARAFRRWVTSEVLPAIRKTGHYRPNGSSYGFKEPPFTDPGRYVSVLTEHGWHSYYSPYATILDEMDGADVRTLAHSIKLIEGFWHKLQILDVARPEYLDSFAWTSLGRAIRGAADSADQYLAVHEERRRSDLPAH